MVSLSFGSRSLDAAFDRYISTPADERWPLDDDDHDLEDYDWVDALDANEG